MASFKAITLMIIFSVAAFYAINAVGLAANHADPLWALGGAVVILVALIVNVWIYLAVAGEAPFKWFKE